MTTPRPIVFVALGMGLALLLMGLILITVGWANADAGRRVVANSDIIIDIAVMDATPVAVQATANSPASQAAAPLRVIPANDQTPSPLDTSTTASGATGSMAAGAPGRSANTELNDSGHDTVGIESSAGENSHDSNDDDSDRLLRERDEAYRAVLRQLYATAVGTSAPKLTRPRPTVTQTPAVATSTTTVPAPSTATPAPANPGNPQPPAPQPQPTQPPPQPTDDHHDHGDEHGDEAKTPEPKPTEKHEDD
jgi:hypothetical protein